MKPLIGRYYSLGVVLLRANSQCGEGLARHRICHMIIDVIKLTITISWFESILVNVCRIIVVMKMGMAVAKNILPSLAFHHCSDSI